MFWTDKYRAPGTSTRLGAFAGRPIVVNFRAPGCAPCERERSSFARLVPSLRGTDIALPTAIVINRNGRIVLHHRGALAWR